VELQIGDEVANFLEGADDAGHKFYFL
jgi:hypothetical protein